MRNPLIDRRFRAPRLWSNELLRQIAPLFGGHVINVSGWRDEDKEGGRYREYFSNARSYSLSNRGGYRGQNDNTNWWIDLEAELPADLKNRFDVVFNHTVLEHVFDVFTAVRNLCALSSDVIIIVVPFIQEQHTSPDYSDYWRFTPRGITTLLSKNGFETVLLASTPGRWNAIYHLAVASCQLDKWQHRFDNIKAEVNDGTLFFQSPLNATLRRILHNLPLRSGSHS